MPSGEKATELIKFVWPSECVTTAGNGFSFADRPSRAARATEREAQLASSPSFSIFSPISFAMGVNSSFGRPAQLPICQHIFCVPEEEIRKLVLQLVCC